MNLSAKPISSPGRPEKYYPPPLMRFLKSNAASKSRGKSRSSPMFIRNKNKNNIVQEPTSPKVTCIGQVRSKTRTGKAKPGSNRFCSCFKLKRPKNPKRLKMPKMVKISKNVFLCSVLGKRFVPRWLKPDWSKWVLFFSSGCCRKSEILVGSVKNEEKEEDSQIESESESETAELGVDLGSTCPPKNALLLTRCRSAPYRSASQISRFCSVLETEEKTGDTTEDFENGRENGENIKTVLEKGDLGLIEKKLGDLGLIEKKLGDLGLIEKTLGDLGLIEKKLGDLGLIEKDLGDLGPIEKKMVDLGPNEKTMVDLRLMESILSRKSEEMSRIKAQPLVLMRCKSEPAKTGERLNQHALDSVGN